MFAYSASTKKLSACWRAESSRYDSFSMSSPLSKLMCVRAVSVGRRAARPLLSLHPTHRTHPACLSSLSLPCGHDAALDGARSGLRGVAVGGAFLHALSVFFFSTFETVTDRNYSCHLLQTPN
jgi:hypothetical protein